MKFLREIISVFLYFHFVVPVQMYYIYDDTPQMGYVSMSSGIKTYSNALNIDEQPQILKYLIQPNNLKFHKINKQQNVGNRFRVMKSSPNQIYISSFDNPHKRRFKDSPGRHIEAPAQYIARNVNEMAVKDTKGLSRVNSNQVNPQLRSYNQMNKESKNQMNKYVPNFVQINVNRQEQISADPQKLKLNNNRQLPASSVQRKGNEVYKNVPITAILNKTFHKTTPYNQRNAQVMSKVLDDIIHQIPERSRFKTRQYRKRETDSGFDRKRNGISDTLIKYIGNDNNISKDPNIETSRVGNQENNLQGNPPYALFYRTNPESVENQDDFIIIDSKYNHQETESKFDQDMAVEKSASTIKFREKIKNLSTFYNH